MSIESKTGLNQRTVTAFFDNRGAAEKAKMDVIQLGVPSNMVTIVEGNAAGATTGATSSTTAGQSTAGGQGFWESLKEMFLPDEDRHVYAEGLSRGGYLLSANTDEAHYDRVIHILDTDGSVDMDQRETQWRSEGWSGYNRTGATGATGGTGLTGGTSTAATTGATTTAASGAAGATPLAASTYGETGVTPALGRGTGVAAGEGSIQLAEEQLRVGKRDVNHGRVRLRSYVVETPVHESVQLRSETVEVGRRPVDRALNAGEDLFRDRTIEAEEHEEMAIVSKEARVTEEVSLNKTAQNRTQEINDTVRRTEVKVEDGRTEGTGTRAAGLATGNFGTQIAEHMEVLGSDGVKVGTVDHLDTGDRIKLTKNDSSDGQHHFIPLSWVARVDQHVHLNKAGREALAGRS